MLLSRPGVGALLEVTCPHKEQKISGAKLSPDRGAWKRVAFQVLRSASATFQPSSFPLYLPSTGLSLPLPSLFFSVSVYCALQFSPPLSSHPFHLPRAVSTLSSHLLSSIRSFSSPVSFVFPISSSSTSLSAHTHRTLCPRTTLPSLAAPAPPLSLLHPPSPAASSTRESVPGGASAGRASLRCPAQGGDSHFRQRCPGCGTGRAALPRAGDGPCRCQRRAPGTFVLGPHPARPGTGAVRREGTGRARQPRAAARGDICRGGEGGTEGGRQGRASPPARAGLGPAGR